MASLVALLYIGTAFQFSFSFSLYYKDGDGGRNNRDFFVRFHMVPHESAQPSPQSSLEEGGESTPEEGGEEHPKPEGAEPPLSLVDLLGLVN
jgi:hypothetical protein